MAICGLCGRTLSQRLTLRSMGATHSKRRKTSAAEKDDGEAADLMERGMQPTSARRPPKKGSGREQASLRALSSSRLSQSIDDSGEGRSQSSKRPRQPTTAAPRQRVPVETGEKAVNRAKAAARACVTAKPAAAVAKTVKSAAAKSRKLRETTRRTASEGSATPADAAAGTAGDRASTSADASCSGVSSALRSARRKRAAENEVSTEL